MTIAGLRGVTSDEWQVMSAEKQWRVRSDEQRAQALKEVTPQQFEWWVVVARPSWPWPHGQDARATNEARRGWRFAETMRSADPRLGKQRHLGSTRD
jgi:hypothetical protein